MSIEQLAEARRAHSEATARHSAALDKVRSIRDRIEWSEAKRTEIAQKRLAGQASEADTNELVALGIDLDTLRSMLADAQAAADACQPDEAVRQLAFAERQVENERDMATMNALATRAEALDRALCACIRDIHKIGRNRMGHSSVSQSWRPTEALDRCMRLGVCP